MSATTISPTSSGSPAKAAISRPASGLLLHVDSSNPSRSHGHQVHARFYVSGLISAGRTRQVVRLDDGGHDVFLVPASVHYEVSTEDPLHPYEDSCPLCGITAEYDVPVDPASQDYCVKIHDPLGLEVLLHGTVRGRPALDPQGKRAPLRPGPRPPLGVPDHGGPSGHGGAAAPRPGSAGAAAVTRSGPPPAQEGLRAAV